MYTAFPPITNALVQHPDAGPDIFGRVRSLFTTGTPEELAALEAKLPGTRVITGFGMTEFAGSIALSDPRDEQAYRLAPGRCMGGAEVEIRDLVGGHPLPPGEEGEIVARGPTGFSSYHNNPQATRTAIDDEGWYHTGDLGLIDDKGLLHFRGRLKDMLKVGGENVAAIEIEAYLGSHPAVQAAAVVGLPDERYGEVPVAFIELADGAVATEDELIDYCRGEIASFKVPHIVRFVEEWPMSATKIRKVDLREQIRAEVDRT
jgi:fatty-acyl-CoA synthase